MNYLSVITARGGSKGIPKKNIYPLCGRPLLVYTIECALQANISGDIVVSTDSEEIAEVAKQYREINVIKRPQAISNDTATSESALIHALDEMEKKGNKYFGVLTLQPTSPLRTPQTIKQCVEMFETHIPKYDALATLSENNSFFWQKNEDNDFVPLFPNASRRRQNRQPLYYEDDILWITQADALRETQSVLGTKVLGFLTKNWIEAVDINTMQDMKFAEFLMQGIEN